MIALILTYINAALGALGIIAVTMGNIEAALLLLVGAALCDAFDGFVARLKKQTPKDKVLGTIADSVADMVSFGVLPVIIFTSIASFNVVTGIAVVLYVIAAIHRLVVFTEKALKADMPTRTFTGLPVVMGAVLIPISYVLIGSVQWYGTFLTILVPVLALLFVSKLAIPKPHGPVAYVSYVLIAALVIAGILLW